MTVTFERETVLVLEGMRGVSDACAKCGDAEALFALKGDVVEALETAGDFIALQRRELEDRPVAPTLKSLVMSRTPPVDPKDGDTWGDFNTGKLMVAKDGEWLDPADGIRPNAPAFVRADKLPKSARRDWIEYCLDRFAFVLIGFFAALAVLS